ncbi:xanthine dehydrogenase accessory protein XdhC [Granulosicoccus antarcticus]|uniref:Xanthine dehydrogenase accessory protein XdhC n=1 Tax=Granulosicoccus antarcticus IMCC3135 TaxID=1192854 RepID=A0A2Z2NKR1_9GAMM|nr:xanthine dehydrogenase accessory protein XdhC [Granulosicoccus antarcticus]ASJ71105.1 hypothetical protein IMCC3135_04960 [Granulosicoccus antarcticus IMCC3135]
MSDWLTQVSALADNDTACVLITVVATRGSIPREAGTRMVVSEHHCHGTIGGGHLEFRAIDIARKQLANTDRAETFTERFPLGASLGQCCGGLVHLLFERLQADQQPWLSFVLTQQRQKQAVVMLTQLLPDTQNPGHISSIRRLVVSEQETSGELVGVQQSAIEYARQQLVSSHDNLVDRVDVSQLQISTNAENSETDTDISPAFHPMPLLVETLVPDAFTIHLFGAGHVGQAIVNVLSGLPCKIHWIDSRDDQFPGTLPANVHPLVSDQPDMDVNDIPAGSYVLIMTHNHALDEAICERALQRDDLAYCGLIGSASKRRNFIRRFETRGMSAAGIERLTCPIGMPGLSGKHPGEIAIAVSAELLLLRASDSTTSAQSTHCSRILAKPEFAKRPAFASA